MIFLVSRSATLLLLSFVMLLTACTQTPNYAPVKTVNQALEPTNGYYLRRKPPIQPSVETDKLQQSGDTVIKKQEVSKSLQKSSLNGQVFPKPSQHKPSQAGATGKPSKQAVATAPIISDKGTFNQNQRAQKPKTNKLAGLATNKSQAPKPHQLATLGQQLTDQPKNNSIISGANAIDAKNNQRSNDKSLDNVQLTVKNIKKSIISIDNKKMLKLNFQWPLQGKISRNFSQTDNKGILIKGKSGQAVHAAEAGKAVYCGQGLPGFGNLAVIKHNATYLSAYANNSKLTIKEGEQVAKGQTIGQVGMTGLKKASLHFEIRKNGKPINPLTVLPKQ